MTFEIACNVAFTSFGVSPSTPGSELDACPSGSGAYHSGVPGEPVNDTLLSGCALAIANVDDIEDVTWDNLVIFSVQQQCVKKKMTSFEVPKMMPPCSGEKCICGWFWLAETGTANFYMTAFDCNVTNSLPNATAIAAPSDPTYCPSTNTTCTPTTGAKRPIYTYNTPTNVPWIGNDARAGYHDSWSFTDGTQDVIFEPASKNATGVKIISSTFATSQSSSAADVSAASSSSSSVAKAKVAKLRIGSTNATVSTSSSTSTLASNSTIDDPKCKKRATQRSRLRRGDVHRMRRLDHPLQPHRVNPPVVPHCS